MKIVIKNCSFRLFASLMNKDVSLKSFFFFVTFKNKLSRICFCLAAFFKRISHFYIFQVSHNSRPTWFWDPISPHPWTWWTWTPKKEAPKRDFYLIMQFMLNRIADLYNENSIPNSLLEVSPNPNDFKGTNTQRRYLINTW